MANPTYRQFRRCSELSVSSAAVHVSILYIEVPALKATMHTAALDTMCPALQTSSTFAASKPVRTWQCLICDVLWCCHSHAYECSKLHHCLQTLVS